MHRIIIVTQMHNSQFNQPVKSGRVSLTFPPELFMQIYKIILIRGGYFRTRCSSFLKEALEDS